VWVETPHERRREATTITDEVLTIFTFCLIGLLDRDERETRCDVELGTEFWASKAPWFRNVEISFNCIKLREDLLGDGAASLVFASACRGNEEFQKFCKAVTLNRTSRGGGSHLVNTGWASLGRFIFTLIHENMVMTLDSEMRRMLDEMRSCTSTLPPVEIPPTPTPSTTCSTKSSDAALELRKMGRKQMKSWRRSQARQETFLAAQALKAIWGTCATTSSAQVRNLKRATGLEMSGNCLATRLEKAGVCYTIRLTFIHAQVSCEGCENLSEGRVGNARRRTRSCCRSLPF
jgi:hypothetical protein